MNRAIKYRIYPNEEQNNKFVQTFGCCRKIWNLMLSDKIEYYNKTGKILNTTPAEYKTVYTFLKDVDSLALANVQLHLQQAYKNCFDKKRKKCTGFPKYKSYKHSKRAYTTNNQHGTISIIDKKYIKLPKIGYVKAKIHRFPKSDWKLKSATISQDRDGKFYVSILFEFDKITEPVSNPNKIIGLDYKSDGLYMDSNGKVGTNHKYYRTLHKQLAKQQRKLSKKIGSRKNEVKSNNYLKQLKKVNKIFKHITNQRKDNLHKISTEIANQYDIVCVETLNMKSLANKGFGNGKATLDNGYGLFLNMLEYKLFERGKYFIKVDKWYPSSKMCSNCGCIKELTLQDRVYKCECGLIIDRDLNAAINIKNEGLRLFLQTT